MKAKETLEIAAKLVSGDRAKKHGDMFHSHDRIAKFWSAYLEKNIDAHDVACLMALLKIARTQCGETNSDDYIDMAGYAAIAGELVERLERRSRKRFSEDTF
jgi:hypothetical protein